MNRFALAMGTALATALASSPVVAQSALEHGRSEDSGEDLRLVTVDAVYGRLVRAMGIAEPPELSIGPIHPILIAAEYRPDLLTIRLDDAAYEAARSFGADSLDVLAIILAHELGHFQRQHRLNKQDWVVVQNRSTRDAELEADEFGLFHGYLAGFNTLAVAPRLMEYLLGTSAAISERLATTQTVAESLRPYAELFDAGVYLFLAGQYQPAADAFALISRRFPAPEMLNNAGLAFLMQALDDEEFAYPLELDADSRLRASGERRFGASGDDGARLRTLESAQRRFGEAHGRYPDYLPAVLNLAATHGVMSGLTNLTAEHRAEHRRRAFFHAETARRLAEQADRPATVARAVIVEGIVHAKAGDSAAAVAAFRDAERGEPEIAGANLSLLGEVDSEPGLTLALFPPGTPTIGGHRAVDFMTYWDWTYTAHLAALGFRIFATHGGGWESQVVERDGDIILAAIATRPDYGGDLYGVRIGYPASEFLVFGPADRILPSTTGSYHVYASRGVIFHERDGLVSGWTLYRSID